MPSKAAATGRVTPKKQKKVTTATAWKSGKTYELEVPSGNVCLVKKPDGLKAFLASGTIPNSLMPLVQEALDNDAKDGQIDMKAILTDPEKINDLIAMVDSITVNVVVEPKVHPVPVRSDSGPIPLDERDEELLYVDEVDLEDKMFILNWAMGGVNDLAQFREATTTNVESLVGEQGLPDSTLIVSGADRSS
jgi:hypothetical protein